VEAAVAVADRQLYEQLLDDLMPVADDCAVNGALVCFMGAHAHRIGRLHAALGQAHRAQDWLQRALAVHVTLGARAWQAETCAALAATGGSRAGEYLSHARAIAAELGLHGIAAGLGLELDAPPPARATASLRRVGDMWEVGYEGQIAYLRDVKGLHDLATLLARPGVELAAIDLAGATGTPPRPEATGPTLDRAALAAYRHRLDDLADDLAEAELNDDIGRAGRPVTSVSGSLPSCGGRPAREEPPGRSVRRLPSERVRPSPRASAMPSAASPRSCPILVPTLIDRSALGPRAATTPDMGLGGRPFQRADHALASRTVGPVRGGLQAPSRM
jgi:hypothetical protein